MKLNISENRIRRIVSETLNRFILKESFTNMKQLYHSTPIDTLFNIIRSNSFYLMPSNHGGRGGKYYASLTRHKNNIEGFDCLMYAQASQENDIESYATITFNIPKMSRIHGISIVPFDYYATPTNNDDHNDVVNSKITYQLLKKPKELRGDEQNVLDDMYYDMPEYYNMAEENIVSDTVKEIPNVYDYIDRIDVYFPADLSEYVMEYNPYADAEEEEENYGYKKTLDYAYAICMAIGGTEWEKKVIVNLTENDKTIKTISISEFNKWLNDNEKYKKHSNAGRLYMNKKPMNRDEFYNEREGHYHGHGNHYGYGHHY